MYQKADIRAQSAAKPDKYISNIIEVSKEKSTPLKPVTKKRAKTSDKKAKNVRFTPAKQGAYQTPVKKNLEAKFMDQDKFGNSNLKTAEKSQMTPESPIR